MSRRTRKAAPARGMPRPTVSVCRGCCCGTAKVPDVDHAGLLAELRHSLGETATVRAVECLDACEQADVVVVQPSAEGRGAGGRPVWLGLVNDPDAVKDIAAWVGAGGPGLADAPEILDLYTFRPSRRVQRELDH
ncbi:MULTISPECIES: (2Fe-2S) ferredoxin domain-containing protein [unclassified Streptomyces]|uniref:(2Fe-2S) ferredoxin domain-containing protein n=1 Tax=unclassified Streptomyces TaxID=2593676 RepID=UPI002259819C|nr:MULTISPECIES: (2Fe-2S) ferredoxin domain-containing protein [unclassified Streptomyces]WSP58759.1 (2Fe-2S) ferredoxin domain-containing protein [Streptomyces sp. NBC_01241]WSU20729.1 (2Fe-2S) ferredoxin domain-containing protein [Streptomyces sp. NBC_01108]MCX4790475.1 (2Fe-2S) ferredoxin domain-containing protein [Streptomyces sp. NBC_01221]MCX4793798.1 (2Fe-2S) ferredoxin domain-containing protein [Streptomyces sp. NBC_01242]WSJ35219.1 (2Fe-2S) ferredoxin domain-containing protein [Strept